jgi:acid stress-induced BolA-like protein IbaG/YrbA
MIKLGTLPATADISNQLERAIVGALADAVVQVSAASPGHFSLVVTSAAFAGKSRLARQKLVYQAIAPLMQGGSAPVHAVDSLKTLAPGE